MPQCTICSRIIKSINKRHLHTKVCQAARVLQISELNVKEARMREFHISTELSTVEDLVEDWEEELEFIKAQVSFPIDLTKDNTDIQIGLVFKGQSPTGSVIANGRSAKASALFGDFNLRSLVMSFIQYRVPTHYDSRIFFMHANKAVSSWFLSYGITKRLFYGTEGATSKRRKDVIKQLPVEELRNLSIQIYNDLPDLPETLNLTRCLQHSKFDKSLDDKLWCINDSAIRGFDKLMTESNAFFIRMSMEFNRQHQYLRTLYYTAHPRPVELENAEKLRRAQLSTYRTKELTNMRYECFIRHKW